MTPRQSPSRNPIPGLVCKEMSEKVTKRAASSCQERESLHTDTRCDPTFYLGWSVNALPPIMRCKQCPRDQFGVAELEPDQETPRPPIRFRPADSGLAPTISKAASDDLSKVSGSGHAQSDPHSLNRNCGRDPATTFRCCGTGRYWVLGRLTI